MEELELESVLELARGHDADAMAELYRRYARRVFGLCRYLLGSTETAEDATSEVFLKLRRSIDSYDGSVPFPSWLLRVAGNHCIDALRRKQRERRVIGEAEADAAPLDVAGYYSDLSYDSIAQRLGLKRDHVAVLLFRAKRELRRVLARGRE